MSSCGCDGNNNLNILNQMPQNGLMPNNGQVQTMNNMPMVNPPMVSLQPQQVQQPVVNNTTESIGPINNLVKGESVEEKVVEEPVVNEHVKELKLLLCIILALATHDAVKFFISQSIRLNRGSSSRFIYYPVVVLGALILLNLF